MLVSEPRLTWLEDPEVFAVNRKEAHSDHVYYENTEGRPLPCHLANQT